MELDKKSGGDIFLGAVGGYAVLTRAEFILAYLSSCVLAIIYFRENFKKIICAILITLFIIAPWTIRNYKVSGRFGACFSIIWKYVMDLKL